MLITVMNKNVPKLKIAYLAGFPNHFVLFRVKVHFELLSAAALNFAYLAKIRGGLIIGRQRTEMKRSWATAARTQ
jgi:hypothetical protein